MGTIPASFIATVTPAVVDAGGDALDLVGLILTTSARVPIGTVHSFSSASSVGDYFGSGSTEETLASTYFGGYNGATKTPGSILFAQYNSSAVSAYTRGGDVSGLTLTQLQAISGNMTIVVDGYTRTSGNVSLSAAASFSAAATTLQTALNTAPATQVSMTASISTTVLTVSAVGSGTLAIGQTVVGAGVTVGTRITALGTGTGGTGTYTVSASQTVGSEAMTTTGTAVVVTYDSTSGAFIVTSGITGTPSTAAFGVGTLATSLDLTSATGAVLSQGAAATTPSTFMDGITAVTQDWATFATAFNPDNSGNTNKLAFAAWADDQNDRYAYVCWDTDTSPTTQDPATSSLGYLIDAADYSGTCLIYAPDATLAAFICGVAAAINFDAVNGRITFAFRSQSGLTASVSNETIAVNLGGNPQTPGDRGNGYNYYGALATANDDFTFFYPGFVSGPFAWMDSYINQIWLNNNFQLAIVELLTNSNSIPYNAAGRAMIEQALMPTILAGLNFGAFRAGVTLSGSQILEVNSQAGQDIANTLSTQGWYLQVLDATATVRAARGSPPVKFWYMDGESVQVLNMTSILVQ